MAAPSDRLPLDPPQDNQESGQAGGGARDHGHVPLAQVNSYCHAFVTDIVQCVHTYTCVYLVWVKVIDNCNDRALLYKFQQCRIKTQ